MGCEVVSVYQDQIIGQLGYSDVFMQDLIERDHPKQENRQDLYKLNEHIKGITQSYTKGYVFTILLQNIEYFIFSIDRFVIRENLKQRIQKVLPHQNTVSSLDVKGKHCLVGSGGTVTLWDLQFIEIKVLIKLPVCSTSISSIGLTTKYIFVTDCSQPNNLIYSYDVRTSKQKTLKEIPSNEPTFRGLPWKENLHITVAADGVWFMKFHQNENEFEITKGMFGKCPKTSMTCLQIIDDKCIASGGVDGYVYLWKTDCTCFKAIKSHDSQITALLFAQKSLIMCGIDKKIKVISVSFIKKTKNDDQQRELQYEINYMITDSYEKDCPVQCLVYSKVEKYKYYCFTRNGHFFKNKIPSNQLIVKKVNIEQNDDQMLKWNEP